MPLGKELVVIVRAVACTLRVEFPVTEDIVAEIVVFPADVAEPRPFELTVATAVFDEAQLAWLLMFGVLPLEQVPVAVNCCVVPATTFALAGVTAIELSVGAGPA